MGSVIEPPALDDALAEAKALLRIDGTGEDVLLGRLIGDAVALCEAFTGRWLLLREGREVSAASGRWQRLKAAPVAAILGVDALPPDGDPVPLSADDYAIDIDASGDGWLRLLRSDVAATRVQLRFEAGLAPDWAGLPEPLRFGILRLAAHFHGYRDDPAAGGNPPAAVTALWRPWRRLRLD